MIEDDGPPTASAPRECQLCGEGFVDFEHLRRHCDLKHGGWKEYRKRLFFEADQYDGQPLPKKRKRQQLSNFTYHLTHSIPGDGGPPERRRQEACAVCARKDSLEFRYRVYLFKPWVDHCRPIEAAEDEEEEIHKDDEDKKEANPGVWKAQRLRRLLRDKEG